MSAPRPNIEPSVPVKLAPPKDDPISQEELASADGKSRRIYLPLPPPSTPSPLSWVGMTDEKHYPIGRNPDKVWVAIKVCIDSPLHRTMGCDTQKLINAINNRALCSMSLGTRATCLVDPTTVGDPPPPSPSPPFTSPCFKALFKLMFRCM